MPIWKLAPILTASSDDVWAYTNWYGSILVRAPNPGRARQLAARAFRNARKAIPIHHDTPVPSPWLEETTVACQRVAVSTYSPAGPDQVLQPQVIDILRR